MRCNNCGWINSDGRTACEKCNSVLGTMPQNVISRNPVSSDYSYKSEKASRPTERFEMREPRPTILDISKIANNQKNTESSDFIKNDTTEQHKDSCVSCGYPLLPDSSICPNCGTPRSRMTIRPNKKEITETVNGFKLVMLPEGDEKFNPSELDFVGEKVILNRDNTDKQNMTITSREQACISFIDGKWVIENRSDLGTTYIQVNSPIELHNGDIIVLGDRRFKFDAK